MAAVVVGILLFVAGPYLVVRPSRSRRRWCRWSASPSWWHWSAKLVPNTIVGGEAGLAGAAAIFGQNFGQRVSRAQT